MSETLMRQTQALSHFPHIPPPDGIGLVVLPPHPCPYLPGRESVYRATAAEAFDPLLYHEFMNRGFRRSGRMVYQPICRGCRQCVQLRVPTETFQPTKSQRRALRRNVDVVVETALPLPTREKLELYARYCSHWHGHAEAESAEGFVSFLYHSPVETIEFTYRVGDRVIGVGICDVSARSLSSVYFFFEPAEAWRSLGTFSALREIDFAKERGIPHWYAGYWIRDCAAMNYKANFGPAEVLGMDGEWRPLVRDAETLSS